MENKKFYMKKKGEAHINKEWDLDCSSSNSDDEALAASAVNKSSLLPNECHTCLMAKEKKVLLGVSFSVEGPQNEQSRFDSS